MIRTVLGDIEKEAAGCVYSHEHVWIGNSYVSQKFPEFQLDNEQKISSELKTCAELGIKTMIDTMPLACGRNPLAMQRLSQSSGIHLVACTGLHQSKYYPTDHWTNAATVQKLAEAFIKDIEIGIPETDDPEIKNVRSTVKAGLLKFATDLDVIGKREFRAMEAVLIAHKETGAPILTHTTQGTMALEQALFLKENGAKLDHCVLSHVDRMQDLKYQKEVLSTGVSVEYDSLFRWKDTNWTLEFMESLMEEFPNQIVMGMDAARSAYWKSYGGKPGLTFLHEKMKDWFSERGLNSYFEFIFYKNPQRIYNFNQ